MPGPTMIVGLGPAGLGALIAMYKDGTLQQVCDAGLVLVDDSVIAGGGELVGYNVRSDSAGGVFAQCVQPLMHMPQVYNSSALLHIQNLPQGETVALSIAGRLLQEAASAMLEIAESMGATVYLGVAVTRLIPGSGSETFVVLDNGEACTVHNLILAVGGTPYIPPDLEEPYTRRLIHSDVVLHQAGLRHVLDSLSPNPYIIVVGRAHSAFSVADRILLDARSQNWQPGAVTIATRGPVRVTYNSVQEALDDGARITDDDVCPKTGRVFRLCGLRNDSARRYFLSRDGIDKRLAVREMSTATLHRKMRRADLVIAATGFRTDLSRFFGDSITVNPDGTIKVTRRMGSYGLPGIRAMGLGCGSVRSEVSGGERSYTGPVDGVWHYQDVVAPPLLRSLMPELYTNERVDA